MHFWGTNLCSSWKLLGLGATSGTFAEYVTLSTAQTYPIPDSLSSDQAILAEPLANVVHLFRAVSPPPYFRLAIVGAGTMGALALSAGLPIAARDVLAVDVSNQRLQTLRTLGACATINASSPDGTVKAAGPGGRGFDVVIDASGSAAARQTAFDLCRPGGQVVLLGMTAQKSEVDFVTSIRKEHRVVMSFAYTPLYFSRSLELLICRRDRSEAVDLKNATGTWTRSV